VRRTRQCNNLAWGYGKAAAWVVGTLLLPRYYRWQVRKAHRRRRREYAGEHGEDAVALLLSVERMIENDVLAYLQRLGRGGMHCYTVHRAERLDERRPEEWVRFFEAVKEELRKVQADGPTRRIYLFCGLPLPMGVLAGVTLANGPEVIVHHFTGGSYVPLVRVFEKTVTFCESPSPVGVPGAAEQPVAVPLSAPEGEEEQSQP
jgi:hypothetical protein